MRKKVLALTLALTLMLGITAQATGPMRAPSMYPTFTFSGTTANCSILVKTNNAKDSITITAKLLHNGGAIRTWSKGGYGSVQLNGSHTVVRGQTYTLTAQVTVNGVAQQMPPVTKTCP